MAKTAQSQPRKRASMEDVAQRAGVSKAAVSKVIRGAYGVSPSMKTRVDAAIAELGYRPLIAARAMRGSSFSIGLEIPNVGNEFFTQVIQGAAARLAGSGYQLLVAPGLAEFEGAPVLENLADRQVDGLIAISPGVTTKWLEDKALGLPIVLLGRHDDSRNYDTVTNDDRVGTRLAIEHLLRLGHERIAHLTIDGPANVHGARDPHSIRRATYSEVLESAGLEPLVVTCGPVGAAAYQVTRELLRGEPSITAIFAGNDTLGLDALRAVADLGADRQNIAVVGYDGTSFAAHPLVSMTTVDQFGEVMGGAAVELLLERIRGGRTDARHFMITPELRVGASSRSPVR